MNQSGYMTQDERWTNEHIDVCGHLHVPVANSFDPAPTREGWVPFFVNIQLDRTPQKHHIYRRA